MRAWQIDSLSTPARLITQATPAPGPGQALLRIHACALNFADLLMAEGKYQSKPPLPFTPGLELAGEVVALGPDTTGATSSIIAPGTRVACYAGHGGLADYGCFPIDRLIPIPDSMPYAHASAFLIAYGTSHLALWHKARLQEGETLLVTGAAGGVGLTAVEVGKRMGARVIATARGADKLAVARAAGADHLIDSDAPDLKDQLKALGGVDVTYDAVGGAGFDAALRATRPDGRILCIGFAGGEVPKPAANILLVKNIAVIGFWWGAYFDFAPHLVTQSLSTLMGWYATGGLRPHISHHLPLEALPEGLALLQDRKATGKVVMQIG
ncbi:MAG: NADPH:quinone oxidoreductase family protein [Pseudotabrizicola sp.]|uniref:NADPH:quinone oxidoreductase family protein n=1 Tax=Pseudotabrizicola sp. TaxID=2939647 RepID=UPI0027193660|nr:NADPH:quinone oxidoreductase family protein [Pseudotabrizicola sp.]MDO9640151.1 NADPH:quinone oxidoreductase family protein [Pseudotabrizicola sp.]